jgi:hypothetical protein
MKFKPLTDEEIEIMLLVPDGIYQFEVIESTQETSKASGVEQIKLKLKIDDGVNAPRFVYDYLNPGMMRKLSHFMQCTGLTEKYEKGEVFATDCIHQRGQVEIVIRQKRLKPDGTYHQAQNAVKDYINGFIPPDVQQKNEPFVDDLPF